MHGQQQAMTAAAADTQESLVRRLSVVGLWLLIINGMIGAGIFGVPAEAARLTGEFSPWVFAICGVLLLPIMLCFAQLGSYFTGTGGPVLYAGTAFGPIVGFQVGWCLYIARLLLLPQTPICLSVLWRISWEALVRDCE
jgi:amino acid transporter